MPLTTQRDLVKLALAPSQTEREKAARTHAAIREHLESDPAISGYNIDTYLQGSESFVSSEVLLREYLC